MENKVVEWKEVSSRLMWVRVRMGRECWAFVSAYGPGCERSEEERDEFWNGLTRCVDGLTTRNFVVVLGDLNARVGDGEVEGVVGKYGVPGENESGERLLNMCVEQELVIGNSFFKKKEINKYTWIRVANGRVIERALMDYVLITKRMVGRLKDVHVFRGVAACGKRFVGGCMRRGSEWWNEGVKMKVEEKKRAFEEWLQCNSVEKYERYREKNVEAKRKVEEAKRMSNFKWGQDFDRSYEENKKKFWKEVRRVKKGGSRTEETVKDVNGRLLRGKDGLNILRSC